MIRTLAAALATSTCIVALATPAAAQTREYNIPAGSLKSALDAYVRQSGRQVVYRADQVRWARSPGTRGQQSAEAALAAVLSGSGFTTRVDGNLIAVVREGNAGTSSRIEESSGETATNADDSSDIIVTASRREQRLRDVPSSVSAFSEKYLERTGAQGAQDYLAQVPGVAYFDRGRGRSAIVIRGVATETGNSNLQPTTEIYLDDLPLTDRFNSWSQPDIDTFDVERVEVLRGPQGTLFGSGSIGGLLRLITNKPDLRDYAAKLELGIAATDGGDDSNSVKGMLNIPLLKDQLGLRVVGFRRRDGGYIDNVVYDRKNVDGGYAEGGRAILNYRPSGRLDIRLTAHYDRQVLDDQPLGFRDASDGGPYQSARFAPETIDAKLQVYNLNLEYDFGGVNLVSTTTYGKRDAFLENGDFVKLLGYLGSSFFGYDPAGPNDLAWIRNRSRRFAQEVRLSSANGGPLQWTVGGFLLKYRVNVDQLWRVGIPTPTTYLDQQIRVRLTEAALFGELTYNVTDTLSFTAGARAVTNEFSSETASTGPFGAPTPLVRDVSRTISPKFAVSFRPTDGLHLYATASKGYRIGQTNFNSGLAPSVPPGYGPDSLWNYEAGVKTSLFDNKVQANLAAYWIDWSDIQLSLVAFDGNGDVIPGSNHVSNAGRARIRGLEAEVTVRPSEHLSIGTSLNYTDAIMRSVRRGVDLVPGSRLPGPQFGATSYAELTTNVFKDAQAYLRLTHRYVSSSPQSIQAIRGFNPGAYNKLDLRGGVEFGNYELALYVNNLTNSDAIVAGGGDGNPAVGVGYEAYVTRLRPRTVGAVFRADF